MKKFLSLALRIIMLTLGALLYAVSISVFLNPLNLAPGGVSGIAIIINSLTGFSTGLMIFLFNLPLMVIAFIKFGKDFCFSTLYVVGVYSTATDIISKLTDGKAVITDDPLLAAFAGGALMAVAIGIVFRSGGSTGGSDILIKMLRRRYRHINTGTIFFGFDLVVIAASAVAFKNIEVALYALITVFISSRLLDFVLYGLDRGKLVYIISDHGQVIANRLLVELDTGVTFTEGSGAYSGASKRILMCAVKNHNFPKLRQIVKDEDKNAFIIVSDTAEIIGEGHKPIEKEDL